MAFIKLHESRYVLYLLYSILVLWRLGFRVATTELGIHPVDNLVNKMQCSRLLTLLTLIVLMMMMNLITAYFICSDYAVINNKYIDSFKIWDLKRSCHDVKHAKIKLLKSKKPGPIRLVDDYSQALLCSLCLWVCQDWWSMRDI